MSAFFSSKTLFIFLIVICISIISIFNYLIGLIKCATLINEERQAMTQSTKVTDELIREIVGAVEALRYGSVEITVHEGRVTQIEKREKVRFGHEISNIRPTVKAAARN